QGSATGGAELGLADGKLETTLSLHLKETGNADFGTGGATLRLTGKTVIGAAPTGIPPTSQSVPPILANLDAQLSAQSNGLRFKTIKADSAQIDLDIKGDRLTLRALELVRAGNSISARGTYRLPRNAASAPESPVEGEFSIKAPRIDDFGFA
ncbi:MAG: hypothetical protein V4710_17265, partial [Verrucomicrobiota bacterium]